VEWRKSITKHTVTCLECGQSFKQLSVRHLMMHGLDGRSYRLKYRIPRTQPLAAKTTTERRRELAQEIRPWAQAPTFRKAQAHDGHAASEPAADVPHAEIEEPAAAAPVQPKRQRKTTQKKQRTRKAAQTP
jgi:hypothetical protein